MPQHTLTSSLPADASAKTITRDKEVRNYIHFFGLHHLDAAFIDNVLPLKPGINDVFKLRTVGAARPVCDLAEYWALKAIALETFDEVKLKNGCSEFDRGSAHSPMTVRCITHDADLIEVTFLSTRKLLRSFYFAVPFGMPLCPTGTELQPTWPPGGPSDPLPTTWEKMDGRYVYPQTGILLFGCSQEGAYGCKNVDKKANKGENSAAVAKIEEEDGERKDYAAVVRENKDDAGGAKEKKGLNAVRLDLVERKCFKPWTHFEFDPSTKRLYRDCKTCREKKSIKGR
ncbi:hypothetical protein BJ878DRAFT_550253 [Calycina marina]|uniref:Uncharacterized protein n=1 Tax=Calycina marina TaxID=1763456 RepID=A0A9P8CEV4_9HELO|nr:hypothetical protein BJ878DRAFT_550253 [Calycina marina]